jgi:dihydrofolate reductase
MVVNFISLDGVMQGPLFPDDDREGNFDQGGWVSPFIDDTVARFMADATTQAGGMLLGRKTYDSFAAIWPVADNSEPAVATMNRIPKYLVSRTTLTGSWHPTTVIGQDLAAEVASLKAQSGGPIVIFGSGELLQELMVNDLVDEYRLLVMPIVLGKGKRMFRDGSSLANLDLIGCATSRSGVIMATYRPVREWKDTTGREHVT